MDFLLSARGLFNYCFICYNEQSTNSCFYSFSLDTILFYNTGNGGNVGRTIGLLKLDCRSGTTTPNLYEPKLDFDRDLLDFS